MKKVTIKGDNFDSFEIDVKEFNLTKREKLNAVLYKLYKGEEGTFSHSVNIIRLATTMTDEDINNLSNDQIFQTAIEISDIVNKKKLKK
tara:strand:- start:29 stop:295 length:267 start_codon:yes stop_codon:yes gene_type:complete